MAAQMDEHAIAGLEDEEEGGVCVRRTERSRDWSRADALTVCVFFFAGHGQFDGVVVHRGA